MSDTIASADDPTVAAALAGDERAFAAVTERHRRELHVHCYRMLASFDEAEDAVQETFLRAWRSRDSFGGDALFRPWLYRIATNICVDMIRSRRRQVADLRSSEVSWLQPYPDRLLDELGDTGAVAATGATGGRRRALVGPDDEQPDDVVVARETIELVFLVALQVLPPRQRAALILRDVLGRPATETAWLLDTSVAAANSAVQRARATMQEHLPSHRHAWTAAEPGPEERELLAKFIDAHERCDAAAAAAIAAQDVRVTMPPYPWHYDGFEDFQRLLDRAFGERRDGDWRLLPTGLNRMPAAGCYLRRPGDSEFRAFKLDVLRIEDGTVAEITTFGPALFPELGLPPAL